MGKRDRRELLSRLKILLGHLLKWRYQPTHRCSSWRGSMIEQRLQINDLLADCPSLNPQLPELLALAYGDAVRLAAGETGLAPSSFPERVPFDVGQTLDDGFFPEA